MMGPEMTYEEHLWVAVVQNDWDSALGKRVNGFELDLLERIDERRQERLGTFLEAHT